MNALDRLGFKQQWQQLQTRFSALKPREQILVMAAGVAIVLALCDQLFWSPLARGNAQHRAAIGATQQQLDQTRTARADIEAKLAEDPDAPLRRDLDAVNARLAKQNEQLAQLTVDLIPPDAMAGVLRKVLAERGNVQLLALRNEPAEPAFTPRADTAANAADEAADDKAESEHTRVAIYRHGLTLELKGRYFDILDYLQALERLEWHFYWDKLEYKVERYPEAIVTLKVYTLSNRESWIGA